MAAPTTAAAASASSSSSKNTTTTSESTKTTTKSTSATEAPPTVLLYMMAFCAWFARMVDRLLPASISNFYDVWTLMICDLIRPAVSRFRATGVDQCARPRELLELYDSEQNFGCRSVRETMSHLDLDHKVYPCPLESLDASKDELCLNSRFRPTVKKETQSLQVPYLVDPNTSVKVQGSEPIIKYLWKTYGDKALPSRTYSLLRNPSVNFATQMIFSFLRPRMYMGRLRAPSRKPEKPLELFGYESTGFVRRVREVLCSCELPYVSRVLPMGSEKRKLFAKEHAKELEGARARAGLIKVPFLRDPNSGTELFESAEIVAYLQAKYQTAPVPKDRWTEASVSF